MKGTVPLDAIDPPALADYAGIVGHLLAKGHARTSGASMIAGYAGRSDKLDRALPGSPGLTPTRPRPITAYSWPRSGAATYRPRTTPSKAGPRSVHESPAQAETTYTQASTGTECPRTQHPKRPSPGLRCGSGDATNEPHP